MASSLMSPRTAAHTLCPLRELWTTIFEELNVMQFDEWTTPQIRKDLRNLRRAMNVKENVLNLTARGQMLSSASGFLAAKIAALEMLQDDIYAENDNEYAAGYEYSLQRLRRLEAAASAWEKVYKA
jgi:hypothetical protein